MRIGPDTHKLQLLPSGADWTWGDAADPWLWGGRLADGCLSNPGCEAGVAEKMAEVADTVDATNLPGDHERLFAGIEALVRSQPRPNHPDRGITSAHDRTVEALQELPAAARATACNRAPATCGP